MAKKEPKTNAMRMLERAKIPFEVHRYECKEFIDGITIADMLNEPYERVFKTLVTEGKGGGYFVFVIPIDQELDLKKAAKAAGEKSVEMIHVKDINKITGYIRGGCTAIGMKKDYPTVLDESANAQEKIIVSGGTILQTARCMEFKTPEGQQKAAEICKKHGIDGIIVIGGDGSFRGAQKLAALGINTIGLPGTIDLDIACTEYTIGFDTAVNTAMEAIDKVRDTSTSHERCSIIEVMGRGAGYIALWCGIANGAEDILLPEKYDYDEQKIVNHIIENRKRGKQHHIIVNAEGIGHSASMAKRIEAATGVETRATILGHMQRGGSPTCKDRVYASTMGALAVDLLCEGKSNRVVGYRHGDFVDDDIDEALAMQKSIPEYQYQISKNLSM